jgi:hypothetical protein
MIVQSLPVAKAKCRSIRFLANCEDGSPEPSDPAVTSTDGSGEPSSRLLILYFRGIKKAREEKIPGFF